MRWRCFVVSLLVLGLLTPWHLRAVTWRDDVAEADVINLAGNILYAPVGQLERSGDITSGVLIGSRWVLTAAHINGSSDFTFTIGTNSYSSVNVTRHPNWDGDALNGSDLMIIELASDVLGITPATLYTGNAEIGALGTSVGFGQGGSGTAGASGPRGTKRAVTNTIDATSYGTLNSGTMLFYDFDDPPMGPTNNVMGSSAATTYEGMVAPGDSGGGLFANIGGTDYLVGIHSFVLDLSGDPSFNYGDLAGSTRVSSYVDWIESVVIPEPSTPGMLVLSLLALLAQKRRR